MRGNKTAPLQSTNTIEFLQCAAHAHVLVEITTRKLIVKPLQVLGIGPELSGLDDVPILHNASNSQDAIAEAKIHVAIQ